MADHSRSQSQMEQLKGADVERTGLREPREVVCPMQGEAVS